MTQVALAAQLNIKPQALCSYELGKRRWPPDLLARVHTILETGQSTPYKEWFLSWHEHLMRSGWYQWQVEVDPGPNWASLPPGYDEFYRQLRPTRTPPDLFRQLVRIDSGLEGCVYSLLCEAGAKPVLASPVALHFPHHPLLDGQSKCLGLARRAAFLLDNGWLLWPQVPIQLPKHVVRPDCLAAGPDGCWAALEFDGPHHKLSEWDKQRDAKLKIEVLRFTQAEIFGPNFIDVLHCALQNIWKKLTGRSQHLGLSNPLQG